MPLAVSLVLYVLIGSVKPEDTPERDAVLARINAGDGDDGGPYDHGTTATASTIPPQGGGGAPAPQPRG